METESGAEFISPAHVRHILRYTKACQYLSPQWKVLDAACGTGYGTYIISRQNSVIGFDNSEDALIEARKNYPQLSFLNVNLMENYGVDYFDAVVLIEAIEHFKPADHPMILKNLRSLMSGKGVLILTTPYCEQSGPSPITKQHLWEFSLTGLEICLDAADFRVKAIFPERYEGKAGRLGYCMVVAETSANSREIR